MQVHIPSFMSPQYMLPYDLKQNEGTHEGKEKTLEDIDEGQIVEAHDDEREENEIGEEGEKEKPTQHGTGEET